MKTGIGKLLQIEQGNRPMIGALLIQAVCTGIFTGALELVATSIFLETFGAERVPLAMMISGGAGILITSIYSYFSKQLGVRSFGILNLVAVVYSNLLAHINLIKINMRRAPLNRVFLNILDNISLKREIGRVLKCVFHITPHLNIYSLN